MYDMTSRPLSSPFQQNSNHKASFANKMAVDEFKAITKAFSGLGVDEKSLITILGKWNPDQRKTFRKGTRDQFFKEDERQFERWLDHHVLQLRQEFLRLKDAAVLWTMHPWERDARIFHEALHGGPRFDLLIETACTRSSEELLGARKAYHSLYERSIEEDIATFVQGSERKLLVALVSAYRYEGPHVKQEPAKSDAKSLHNAIKNVAKKKPIEDDEIVLILSTRSKLHIKEVYKHYKEISGKNLDEDLGGDLILKQTVQCLSVPQTYFCQVLNASLRTDVDEAARDSVTRVIVTRADFDMKHIKEEYQRKYGVSLPNKIEEVANGSYKEFLLTLIARGD